MSSSVSITEELGLNGKKRGRCDTYDLCYDDRSPKRSRYLDDNVPVDEILTVFRKVLLEHGYQHNRIRMIQNGLFPDASAVLQFWNELEKSCLLKDTITSRARQYEAKYSNSCILYK